MAGMKALAAAGMAAVLLAACATKAEEAEPAMSSEQADFLEMMAPGRPKGAALRKAFADAGKHPLGSRQNPVRADMPAGQRLYLSKLRCSNGQPPSAQRSGNIGAGPYGSILDLYTLDCRGAKPEKAEVVMDMYFPGYAETRPLPGFTIVE